MKIRDERKSHGFDKKCINDIPVGTVFAGIIGHYGIHLRTFDEVVDLADPTNTWTCEESGEAIVHDYLKLNAELVLK